MKRKIMRLSFGIFEPAGYFWCSARARLSKYLSFQKVVLLLILYFPPFSISGRYSAPVHTLVGSLFYLIYIITYSELLSLPKVDSILCFSIASQCD